MSRKYMSGGTLTAPIPPALVTVGNMEDSNVLTVAWTGILSTKPPRTYVSVRPSRHSYGYIKESGEFVINLPTARMAKEVDYVGIYTGKKVDKFTRCGFTRIKSDKVSPPTIKECPIALECRVVQVLPMGTHDVFVADIVGVSCDERLMDGDGKIHFERAGLMVYAHGEYYALGELVGRFGFSTDKDVNIGAEKGSKADGSLRKTTEKRGRAEKSEDTSSDAYFYNGAPRKRAKRDLKDKNKGRPHGKRIREKKV